MAGANGTADPDAGPGSQWDVALSFAGAQRDFVEQVAAALKARGLRCFYDADEQIELWGKYLAEELPAIYGEQAAVVVVVVFVSAQYAAQDWTRHERRASLARAVRERREYVLPARFDDTPLPGLLSDTVTVDLRTRTPQQFAAMIAAKLAVLAVTAPSADAGDPTRDVGSARPAGAVLAGAADLRPPARAWTPPGRAAASAAASPSSARPRLPPCAACTRPPDRTASGCTPSPRSPRPSACTAPPCTTTSRRRADMAAGPAGCAPARRAGRPPRAAPPQHRRRRGDRAARRRRRPGRPPARRALPATTPTPTRPRRRQRAAVLTRRRRPAAGSPS